MGLTITKVEKQRRARPSPQHHKYHNKRTIKPHTSRRAGRQDGLSSRSFRSAETCRDRARLGEQTRRPETPRTTPADLTISLEISQQAASHDVEESTRVVQEGRPRQARDDIPGKGGGEHGTNKQEIIEASTRVIGLTSRRGNSDADLEQQKELLVRSRHDKGTQNLTKNRESQTDIKAGYPVLESMLEGLCQMSVDLLNRDRLEKGLLENRLGFTIPGLNFTSLENNPSLLQKDGTTYIDDKMQGIELPVQSQQHEQPEASDLACNALQETTCPSAPQEQVYVQPVFNLPVLPIRSQPIKGTYDLNYQAEKFLSGPVLTEICQTVRTSPYFSQTQNDWVPPVLSLSKNENDNVKDYSGMKITEKVSDIELESQTEVEHTEGRLQTAIENFTTPVIAEVTGKERTCIYGQWAYLHPVFLVNDSEAWRPYADVCPCVNCSYSLGSCLSLPRPKIGWEQLYCGMAASSSFSPFTPQ